MTEIINTEFSYRVNENLKAFKNNIKSVKKRIFLPTVYENTKKTENNNNVDKTHCFYYRLTKINCAFLLHTPAINYCFFFY